MTEVLIKERPILFKSEMVRAIQTGLKDQTRRIVKPGPGMQADWLSPEVLQTSPSCYTATIEAGKNKGKFGAQFEHPKGGPLTFVFCPYGKVGDRLWVRETWFPMRYDWKEFGDIAPFLYADGTIANRERWAETYEGTKPPMGHAWKSAMYMPRIASRILLEITDIRVERLQDISQEDVQAEGCTGSLLGPMADAMLYPTLWESIHGKGSWQANPWVWKISFRVL